MFGGGGAAAPLDQNKAIRFVAQCLLNPRTDYTRGDAGTGCQYERVDNTRFRIFFERTIKDPVRVVRDARTLLASSPVDIMFGTYTEIENFAVHFAYKLDDENVWVVDHVNALNPNINQAVLQCGKLTLKDWRDMYGNDEMDTGTGTRMRRVRDLTFIA